MENICQKKPIALMELTSREIVRNIYTQKLREFVEKIKAKG